MIDKPTPTMIDTTSLKKMLIGASAALQQVHASRTNLIQGDGNRVSDEQTLNLVIHTMGLVSIGVAAILELIGGMDL